MHDRANQRIQQLLEDLRAERSEEGVQVCCTLNGETVIDTWAGIADPATRGTVDGDSIFTIFSATKGVSATCLHLLADRGRLDYDTPVAEIWPEFGQRGKQTVTIRHVLTHRSGIPFLPEGLEPEDLCDWDGMCARFAAMPPAFAPGSATAYQSLNYNWLAGEIVRRVDGRPIRDFLQDELCRPLGITGLHLGIPDELESRVAPVIASGGDDSPSGVGIDRASLSNLPAVRRSWWRGMGNARSLARLYAMLAAGGALDGVRVLSEERVRIATSLQTYDYDHVLGRRIRRGLVYQLGIGGSASAFGHSGGGGTLAFADPVTRFSFAYTKNLHAAPLSAVRKAATGLASQALIVAQACREALDIA